MGHTESYIGYSPDCHLNIVGCLLTKRLTKRGEGVTGTPGPPGYALAKFSDTRFLYKRRLQLAVQTCFNSNLLRLQ